MKIFLLICFVIILNASDTYDEALQYLDGDKGALEEKRVVPRCPYERCDGKTTYMHVKKDLKKGYELLKKAHSEGDDRASNRALYILLKQIDYKSKSYDDYLVEKLKEDYNLSVENYNNDVLSFLKSLAKSNEEKYRCKGGFGLYEANKKKYFGITESDKNMVNVNKEIALSSCINSSFEYLKLTNTEGNNE